jgi:hypothetical protein
VGPLEIDAESCSEADMQLVMCGCYQQTSLTHCKP